MKNKNMIKLKSKDYDLKSLFQYDLLRDILLSLAEYQNDIHSEIIALKNNSKAHDIRLSKLEEKNDIKFDPAEFNINITNIEPSPIFENIKTEDGDKKEKDEKSEKNNTEKKGSEKKTLKKKMIKIFLVKRKKMMTKKKKRKKLVVNLNIY